MYCETGPAITRKGDHVHTLACKTSGPSWGAAHSHAVGTRQNGMGCTGCKSGLGDVEPRTIFLLLGAAAIGAYFLPSVLKKMY